MKIILYIILTDFIMKRTSLISLALMAGASLFGTPRQHSDISVEPPCWWTGMADDTLQLMVSGTGIARAEASLNYPGVHIAEQLSLDSPNYKLLYLVIGDDARPGTIDIAFSEGKWSQTVKYELLPRTRKPEEYQGFDASDVLYLLMPDRFAQGSEPTDCDTVLDYCVDIDRSDPNARHGGDIRGITEHLDYLDSLGVTAVWVCPVLKNDMPGGSYHGYATTDYYNVDPRFGTNEQWRGMIECAHRRGMKVVMDMIFNHSGSNHPWMKDMPSKDWYNHPEGDNLTNFRLTTVHDPYVSDYDYDHTVNGWFVKEMPDLNQRNPHVMKYLIQNSIWWIEWSKIDGIRMDTYPYADMQAMSQWAAAVMKEYPRFNIVGECWYSNEAGSAFWQSGSKLNPVDTHLPTVMDFFYILNGREAFMSDTTPWDGLNKVYDHLSLDFLYPDPQKILTFLDNHDTDRFLIEEPDDLGVWKQAIAFLLTSRGIPQIYYGTEILMSGTKKETDGNVRRDFPGGFRGDKVNAFRKEGRTLLQNEAWDYISKLLNWRRSEANEVIAKGAMKHFMPQNGIYAYRRKLDDKEVIVLLNGRDEANTVTMERTLEILPYGTSFTDVITGKPVVISPEMTFAPRQVMILQNF